MSSFNLSCDHFDLFPVGVCIVDRALKVHCWNKLLAEWTGKTSELVVGKVLPDLFPSVDDPHVLIRLNEVFEQNQTVVFSPVIHKHFIPVPSLDRKYKALMIQKTMVRPVDPNGEFAIVIIEDVTTQARQIEELRRERRKIKYRAAHLKAIIDATPLCVKTVSIDGVVLDINQAGANMVGGDDPSLYRGKSVYDLIVPEQREAYIEFHKNVCNKIPGEMEYQIIHTDGSFPWVTTHAVPLEAQSGAVLHPGTSSDVK